MRGCMASAATICDATGCPVWFMCGRLRFGKVYSGCNHGRVLSCVRPVDAAPCAAGPNAIRLGRGPNH
jgi:hypothetical protein